MHNKVLHENRNCLKKDWKKDMDVAEALAHNEDKPTSALLKSIIFETITQVAKALPSSKS